MLDFTIVIFHYAHIISLQKVDYLLSRIEKISAIPISYRFCQKGGHSFSRMNFEIEFESTLVFMQGHDCYLHFLRKYFFYLFFRLDRVNKLGPAKVNKKLAREKQGHSNTKIKKFN